MIKTELRRGDGLPSGRIWLESVVRNVQRGLVHANFPLKPDGKFGTGTQRVVREFQRASNTEPTGIVAKTTWSGLAEHLDATVEQQAAAERALIPAFRGDLEWVHAREGHKGRPYWPGGASGVTLDPGVDLGHVPPERVAELFDGILSARELRLLAQVFGLKGEHARTALNAVAGVKDIRISREAAYQLMPHAAAPYWTGIANRMSGLRRRDTPPSVQTVLLSLAYNRGVFNRGLASLESLIRNRNWPDVPRIIGSMQQRHQLDGIRIRRRHEAGLVSAELSFLGVGST